MTTEPVTTFTTLRHLGCPIMYADHNAFKHLVKHYILLTNFYDTVTPLASGTERVTAKLDALMPPRCGARTFCLAIKKTICISDAAQHERRAGMKPYSDGWVELVVLKFLASEVDFQ